MMKREARNKLLLLSCMAFCLIFTATLVSAVEGTSAGAEECKECHAEVTKSFTGNIHSKAGAYGVPGAGCQTCHGSAAAHIESGDKGAIRNPANLDREAASATCLECHSRGKGQMFWHGSIHETQYSCLACHKVHGGHQKMLAKKTETDLCVSCHLNVRADMFKRSKHPLLDSSSKSGEGKMTCSSCHNVHGAKGEKLIDAKSFNDKCYECHFELKAPRLWEHSPVKEDCLTCHSPHGSSNDNMLVAPAPRLCQQCHMQGRHQSGALGTNSVYTGNRSCMNCHSQIHGSNNPSGAILQR